MKRLKIAYKKDGHDYEITLMVRFKGVFALAAHRAEISGKKNEEFVAAVLRASPGAVCEIFRRRDGKKHDGAGGEPAQEHFSRAGKIMRIARFAEGKLNDGAHGAPAVQTFSAQGRLLYEDHRRNGKLAENPKGGPAARKFDDAGNLVCYGHCINGRLYFYRPDGKPYKRSH